jgi:UDP-2,3-diacylglucosamine hydrolase
VPTAVIVSDAHLGAPHPPDDFLRFLHTVPDLGDQLIINGDLFDFWFEYGTVVPRRTFRVLSALHQLTARGVTLVVTGGNHDRWGGPFWEEEVGATFHPEGVRLLLAGWRCVLRHGDGLSETRATARLMHRVTRWRATAAAFRWLHPDLGLRMIDALSGGLAQQTREGAVLARAAEAQAAWAQAFLEREPDVDLLVMGHTHRATLRPVAERRWYLNPGAWCEGRCYAVLTTEGPELRTYSAP